MNEIIINNNGGTLTVSSMQVAENFEKDHKNILRDIEELKKGWLKIEQTPQEPHNIERFFIESTYVHPQNKQTYKCYELTRDGFSLLVMGFTGKKALEWKLKYIEAFNLMEQKLKEQSTKIDSYMINDPIQRANRWIEEYQEKVALQEKVTEQAPKVEYHDKVLNQANLITPTTIAKDMGLKSASELNKLLHNKGVIYKQGNVWHPYAQYEWLLTENYIDYKSYDDKEVAPQLRWTEKGRKWLMENFLNEYRYSQLAFGV
jgi:Rha family phage regulatory protein